MVLIVISGTRYPFVEHKTTYVTPLSLAETNGSITQLNLTATGNNMLLYIAKCSTLKVLNLIYLTKYIIFNSF